MKERLLEEAERNKQELLLREESMKAAAMFFFRIIDSSSTSINMHLQNTSYSLLGSSSSICLHLTDR